MPSEFQSNLSLYYFDLLSKLGCLPLRRFTVLAQVFGESPVESFFSVLEREGLAGFWKGSNLIVTEFFFKFFQTGMQNWIFQLSRTYLPTHHLVKTLVPPLGIAAGLFLVYPLDYIYSVQAAAIGKNNWQKTIDRAFSRSFFSLYTGFYLQASLPFVHVALNRLELDSIHPTGAAIVRYGLGAVVASCLDKIRRKMIVEDDQGNRPTLWSCIYEIFENDGGILAFFDGFGQHALSSGATFAAFRFMVDKMNR